MTSEKVAAVRGAIQQHYGPDAVVRLVKAETGAQFEVPHDGIDTRIVIEQPLFDDFENAQALGEHVSIMLAKVRRQSTIVTISRIGQIDQH